MDCWVRTSEWLACCYKMVYIHIGSVYYFFKIWMNIFWVIFVDYFLNFNTCKYSIFVIMIIALRWIVELEQASGLHGAIRQFTFISKVFTIFLKFGWIFFELYLLITFWTLILVSILYLWLQQLYWEDCCVEASG